MSEESHCNPSDRSKRRFAYALVPFVCATVFGVAFIWLADLMEFTSPLYVDAAAHVDASNAGPPDATSVEEPATLAKASSTAKEDQTNLKKPAYKVLPTDFKIYYEDSVRRAVWGIMSHALMCCIFLSVACSILSILNCLSETGKWRWGVIALAALCSAGGWFYIQDASLSGGVGGSLYDLATKQSAHQFNVKATMNHIMGNVVVASVFVIFSCACICYSSTRTEREYQLKLYRVFKFNLGMTALFLCIGTIQTYALYEWLTTFLVEVPVGTPIQPGEIPPHAYVSGESVVPMIKGGMTLAVSFFYTVCFGFIFLPTYLIFKEGAVKWANSEIGPRSPGAALEFLAKHGIQFKARNILNVLTVLSSPLIVSVVTEILK